MEYQHALGYNVVCKTKAILSQCSGVLKNLLYIRSTFQVVVVDMSKISAHIKFKGTFGTVCKTLCTVLQIVPNVQEG